MNSSNTYEPKGMVFWSQGRSIMHVSDEEPRESLRGWLLYRHPDGQWVTLRKATDADLEAIYSAGVEDGRVIVKLPDNRLSDKEVESTGLICGGAVQAIARELLESRRKLRTINSRIETLIGVTCSRCEKGDPLFVEPDTGFYTHSLGGNYCSAHKLHSLLDTESSRRARSQETSACMCGHPRYLHERRNTPQEFEDCRAKLCNCTHFMRQS